MGLCKCPKKIVTNQFCFEHRVNVCEHCMVSNHTKCVVQSYLQWLQDSDYDPNCQLCKSELINGECQRLVCYHIFHWACLNKYASELPAQTAPAGYTCPTCNACIFPPANIVSPVADALRIALLGVNWARSGLGFPLISEIPETQKIVGSLIPLSQPSKLTVSQSEGSRPTSAKGSITNPNQGQGMAVNTSKRPEPYGASFTSSSFSSPRKMYDATEHGLFRPSLVDHDEDKYKRRSAFEWLSRWFKSRAVLGGSHRKDPHVFYKRWVVLVALGLLAFCTFIIFFLRMGRASADSDPLLDPYLNPNIRVQDSMEIVMSPSAQVVSNLVDKDNAVQVDNNAKLGLPG